MNFDGSNGNGEIQPPCSSTAQENYSPLILFHHTYMRPIPNDEGRVENGPALFYARFKR